jgi:uncharacterized protein YdhG (YjbR/CyaY superfamily)
LNADDAHEAHFAKAAPEIRRRLEQIRAEVERRAPDARRCIGYGMPAFRARKIFFYFAAFKKHIGVYPPVKGPEALLAALAPFRGPNGNLIFPHAQPLPIDLIGNVAERLLEQYGDAART